MIYNNKCHVRILTQILIHTTSNKSLQIMWYLIVLFCLYINIKLQFHITIEVFSTNKTDGDCPVKHHNTQS